MSIVVVPSTWVGVPHPAGRLANTMLSVAVAGMADPARFRKGRQYAAEGHVTRLEVDHGVLRAEVMGSRDMPYDVVVRVGAVDVPAGTSPDELRMLMTRLAPDADDMTSYCTCPDFDGPCKHAAAALLELAGHLIGRPDLLVYWRTADPASPGRPTPTADAPRRTTTTEPPADPWGAQAWKDFLGVAPPPVIDLPVEPLRVRRIPFGALDLGDVVRGALVTLQGDR